MDRDGSSPSSKGTSNGFDKSKEIRVLVKIRLQKKGKIKRECGSAPSNRGLRYY